MLLTVVHLPPFCGPMGGPVLTVVHSLLTNLGRAVCATLIPLPPTQEEQYVPHCPCSHPGAGRREERLTTVLTQEREERRKSINPVLTQEREGRRRVLTTVLTQEREGGESINHCSPKEEPRRVSTTVLTQGGTRRE